MPCTTSALVARSVIGVCAGTRMHAGVKEYCWPMARTVTAPSASSTLPRFGSTNSPARCSRVGSIVSTRACGMVTRWMPANAASSARTMMMATEMVAQRFSVRSATSAP